MMRHTSDFIRNLLQALLHIQLALHTQTRRAQACRCGFTLLHAPWIWFFRHDTRCRCFARVAGGHMERQEHTKPQKHRCFPPPHRREDTEKRSDLRAALAHFEHGVGEPLALLIFIP